jgi:hypothetical protein
MEKSLRWMFDRRWYRAMIALSLVVGAGSAPADEVVVNTYTSSVQSFASVTMNAGGDFVVVWQSDGSFGTDDSSVSVQGQRFASNGSRMGGEFQVNTSTLGQQRRPAVAMDADGDFLVVWHSAFEDGDVPPFLGTVQARRYASNGSALGDQFQVNTITTSAQQDPRVAMEANGDFVVVWLSFCDCGGEAELPTVQGQRFASDGTFLGGEFKVNTETTTQERFLSLAMDEDGDFLVVWQSVDFGTNTSTVEGRRYASDGSPQGGQFMLNAATTNGAIKPAVAMEPDGDFVVVWSENLGNNLLRGQRFASDGSQIGATFQVNTYVDGAYADIPAVGVAANGGFVVSWQARSDGSGTDPGDSIQARGFASDGSSLEDQVQVNTYTPNSPDWSKVAMDADGDFVIVWDLQEIRMRTGKNLAGGSLSFGNVFTDGFEAGDVSAWTLP